MSLYVHFNSLLFALTLSCLQGPNSKVTYKITGDDTARQFFTITPSTGSIALNQSLIGVATKLFMVSVTHASWNLYCILLLQQIQVQASDQGIPPRTADVTVTVTISQDENIPTFTETEYDTEIVQETPVGSRIIAVEASDKDVSVFEHSQTYPNSLVDFSVSCEV